MSEDGDRVKYLAISDKYQNAVGAGTVRSSGGYPEAHVKLSYEQGRGTTPNFELSGFDPGDSYEYRRRTGGSTPPTELFHSDPDRLVIDSAYAHPDMRRHVPRLLAIAQVDNPNMKLTASDALSGYSSRLSRNAAKKGLVLPHPGNEHMVGKRSEISAASDEYERKNMISNARQDESTRIPEHDILNGEQFLREALGYKPKTKQTKAPDTEQLTLPGI